MAKSTGETVHFERVLASKRAAGRPKDRLAVKMQEEMIGTQE
jgi:hypothetical protein